MFRNNHYYETYQTWEEVTFELLSITPCENVLAVYAEEEDEEKKPVFRSYPVRFLALAKATTRFFKKEKGAPDWGKVEHRDEEVENIVVGLDLAEGYFDICNKMGNFSGYCFVGDDISKATSYLNMEWFNDSRFKKQ